MIQNNLNYAIGRTNALLIPNNIQGEAKAIVSPIIARVDDTDSGKTHCFGEICSFTEKVEIHLQETVFPIVDFICEKLHLPRKTCKLSIGNISATGLHNIGLNISGNSADTTVCISLLSCLLGIPIDQSIAITGHISSQDAEIKAVKHLPAKIEAAVASDDIQTLIIPDLHSDISARVLSPREAEKVGEAILKAKSLIKIIIVSDLEGLVREIFSVKSIVQSSLTKKFFTSQLSLPQSNTAVVKTIMYLGHGNEKRFWYVLEEMLFHESFDEARIIIKEFFTYYICRGTYPEKFGTQLHRIILSLPAYILRNLSKSLLDSKNLLELAKLIKDSDLEDLKTLFHVSSDDPATLIPLDNTSLDSSVSVDKISTLANNIVERISLDALSKLTATIDHARAVYIMNSLSVKNITEFNHSITSFYIFILRHTSKVTSPIDQQSASEEAFALVERSFVNMGGYKFAYKEALSALLGGLRYIFDTMTEQLKREEQEKYINYVFKTAVEPLSKPEKAELIKNIIDQFSQFLSPEIVDEPENYVDNYDNLIRHITQAIDKIKSLFKSL